MEYNVVEVEKLLSLCIKPSGSNPVYNCMLAFTKEDEGVHYSNAIGLAGEFGKAIAANDSFRIGSITKLFTTTIILQLKEEGHLNLENCYFDLIDKETCEILSGLHLFEAVDYSRNISVLHLLQHESGLRDYFSGEERFLQYVVKHPLKLWNWKLVMEKFFEFELNFRPLFVPGKGVHYSDTNYLLLGVLIEQITHKPLHQVYRERISEPLGLNDTWLEFYEWPHNMNTVVYPYYRGQSLESINTSFDWGCGGLVSTMNDLDVFIRHLAKGPLLNAAESVGLARQFQAKYPLLCRAGQYGLGIQERKFPGYSFIGHNSVYGSMLFYESEKDISFIVSLNQAAALAKAEWLMRKIINSNATN